MAWNKSPVVVKHWKFLQIDTRMLSRRLMHAETAPFLPPPPPLMPNLIVQNAESKKEKRSWSAVLLFIPGIATFCLGTWQIKRHEWKVALLEHRRKRLGEDIVPLKVALNSTSSQVSLSNGRSSQESFVQSLEYRRVLCEGVFVEDKSFYLGPRGRTTHGVTERGYFLITPLVPASGNGESVQVPVLVNRGWVPGSWRDAHSNPKVEDNVLVESESHEQKKNEHGFLSWVWGRTHETTMVVKPKVQTVNVVGVVRDSENPNMFVPSNDPRSGQWFYIDVPAMAQAAGLSGDTIYLEALKEEDSLKAKDYPLPKDPDALIRSSVMPYDHLTYAATWYTLAAATTFMAWKRLKGVSHGRR